VTNTVDGIDKRELFFCSSDPLCIDKGSGGSKVEEGMDVVVRSDLHVATAIDSALMDLQDAISKDNIVTDKRKAKSIPDVQAGHHTPCLSPVGLQWKHSPGQLQQCRAGGVGTCSSCQC
jgi:hypothetical protein